MPSKWPRKLRAVIVDDEPLARDCIRIALEQDEDVEVAAECPDGESALQAIRELQPDLLFLDVQMPGMDGFQVVQEAGVDSVPAIIFVTAYDEHALRAFEVHALDYLLKPFDDARLLEVVRRARVQLDAERRSSLTERLESLLADQAPADRSATYATRLMVRLRDRIRFVPVREVDWFEGAGNHVRLHIGKDAFLIRSTLTALLDRLDPTQFVRIHRSTIVNLDRIREVQPWASGDYIAILEDGTQLKVSRGCRDDLLRPVL
ncbi:MAG: LytTR family DNA-binding domain-containing protein [Gemmatimonadota bacterium]